MKTQLISFRCPEDLQAQFKKFASTNETTMSQLVIDHIKSIVGSDQTTSPNNAISFDHTAELIRIQSEIVKLAVTISALGDSISASERLTCIIDDLLRVKMMIIFSETMEDSGFRVYNDKQTE